MINVLPALYVWLANVVVGLLVVFVSRYFVDGDKAAVAGFSTAIGIAIGNSASLERSASAWWIDLIGVIAGLATLWWYLFKRKEFGRRS